MTAAIAAQKPRYKLLSDGNVVEIAAFGPHSSHIAADTTDPALAQWRPGAYSADADVLPDIPVMMPRARDLERNNGLASGAVQTLRDNIIGNVLKWTPKPNRQVLGWTVEQADEWGQAAEGWFDTWFGSTEIDATGQQTGWGLSHLALGSAFLNGDALAIPTYHRNSVGMWSTKVQVIEADRLQTPPWRSATKQGRKNAVRGGVEINKYGKPIAYWIRKTHPGDSHYSLGVATGAANDYVRIPATTPWGRRRVIHLYDRQRSGQSRGRTIFASVMKEFKVGDRYTKAELEAAMSNALVAGFLESVADPQSVLDAFGGDASDYDSRMQGFSMRTGPGVLVNLPYGVKPSSHTPSRPNQAFDGFMESILRKTSAGLNLPYEIFAKDFSKTSYASARSALMEAWRYFMTRRRWFSEQWLQPLVELWMEEAVDKHRIDAPDYYTHRLAYTRSKWIMAGRGWTDPWRESRAAEQRMQSGTGNLEDEAAEQGADWRDKLEQRAIELAAYQKAGVPLPSGFVTPQPDDQEQVA